MRLVLFILDAIAIGLVVFALYSAYTAGKLSKQPKKGEKKYGRK